MCPPVFLFGKTYSLPGLDAVNLLQVGLDLAAGHAARIRRDDLVVEAVEAGLTLLDELRLELRVAVARDINVELAALATDGFRGLAIAGVAAVFTGGVVLFVTEMASEFAL
jgi:hypothetical protein